MTASTSETVDLTVPAGSVVGFHRSRTRRQNADHHQGYSPASPYTLMPAPSSCSETSAKHAGSKAIRTETHGRCFDYLPVPRG